MAIPQLTLYCLSTDNWKCPQAELDFLMALLHEYLLAERTEIMEQNIRFTTIGRREGLPPSVLTEMDENIRLSSGNTGTTRCAWRLQLQRPLGDGRWDEKHSRQGQRRSLRSGRH